MSQLRKTILKNDSEKVPVYRLLFSSIILCIVFASLFLVRLHYETLTGESLKIFSSDNGAYADWFLYCKEVMYFIIAAAIVIYSAGERLFPDKPCGINPLYKKSARLPIILLSIYLMLTFLSAFFSDNKEVVWWGSCTEFEGTAAIFSYCILFFGGYNYYSDKKSFDFFKKAFFVLITITSVLAVFEYIVSPVMELPFMKYIIAPPEYREIAEGLESANTFREAVLMFYNSNYMGGFCTIIFPVSIYYIVSSERIYSRIICIAVCTLTFIAGIMSNSTAAFYVMIAEGIFITVIMLIKKIIRLRMLMIPVLIFAAAAVGVNFASANEFIGNIMKSAANSGVYTEIDSLFRLDNIEIVGNSVVFSGNGSEYTITPPFNEGEKLEVEGGENTEFSETRIAHNQILISDASTGKDILAVLNEGVLYLDFGYNDTINFAVTTDGLKAIVQNGQLVDSIPQSQFNNSSLAEYYGFATGRGYTWLNTLPILSDCILIGKGAGNFPFCFIQNDIAGLVNTHGTSQLIIDKPHSWYLQIAVTSGIPALIAVLILFAGFVISGGKRVIKTKAEDYSSDKDKIFLLCVYTGICGFMMMGTVNDSIVTVNPFFWFIFGIACCINTSYGKTSD